MFNNTVAHHLCWHGKFLHDTLTTLHHIHTCSQYVVKYYGSYFKNTDLWIVMEYCGAGSVSDIMRIINRPVSYHRSVDTSALKLSRFTLWLTLCTSAWQLKEEEIAIVLQYALKGLEYLHFKRKIHRDIKAGNILLNLEGHAKLADFGVAGQLTVSVKQ